MQKWIDENAPVLSKWGGAFNEFSTGVLRGWNTKLPQLEQRLSDFATSIEGSLNPHRHCVFVSLAVTAQLALRARWANSSASCCRTFCKMP